MAQMLSRTRGIAVSGSTFCPAKGRLHGQLGSSSGQGFQGSVPVHGSSVLPSFLGGIVIDSSSKSNVLKPLRSEVLLLVEALVPAEGVPLCSPPPHDIKSTRSKSSKKYFKILNFINVL